MDREIIDGSPQDTLAKKIYRNWEIKQLDPLIGKIIYQYTYIHTFGKIDITLQVVNVETPK